jgi:hypothetical protein
LFQDLSFPSIVVGARGTNLEDLVSPQVVLVLWDAEQEGAAHTPLLTQHLQEGRVFHGVAKIPEA